MIGYVSQIYDAATRKEKAAQSVPASLFFRNDEKNMGIDGLPFDLFISEKHRLSFKVSDHPLQNGCTISDHVQRELQDVTIEGMFSNHSVNRDDVPREAIEFDSEYGTTDVLNDKWQNPKPLPNTALQKLEKLRELASKKEPVRLVCSLDIYPKMVITDVSYERDAKSGSSVRFTITLREIVTVDLKYSTSSYNFSPEQIKSMNDKIIASQVNSGNKAGEIKDANELAKLLKVEVF